MKSKESALQAVRYALVGVVNTVLTIAFYWLLKSVGLGVDLANLASYVLGMVCSFALNKVWTFRARRVGNVVRQSLLFVVGAALCWGVQWVAFRALLCIIGEFPAQIIAMGVYTVLNFLFNKLVTFGQRPQEGERPQETIKAGSKRPANNQT